MGLACRDGRGVAKDPAQAAIWYRKAADQGELSAQFLLGAAYQDGNGVERDYAKAAAWYQAMADRGDPRGQIALGKLYENGIGTRREAADRGSPDAELRLALIYYTGATGQRDLAQAVVWMRRAANHDVGKAQGVLGATYANGEGAPRDQTQTLAQAWLRKAADQGDSNAMINLAVAYDTGLAWRGGRSRAGAGLVAQGRRRRRRARPEAGRRGHAGRRPLTPNGVGS